MRGEKILLRAMESSDADWLYQWENTSQLWPLSNTLIPYSREYLMQFVESARNDIYIDRQVRLMICLLDSGSIVGAIDLFEFDPHHRRAGIGILVDDKYRRNGIASEALDIIIKHAFRRIGMKQLFCNILESNKASIALFRSKGFSRCATKKDWLWINGEYHNEIMFQLINDNPDQ